MASTHSAPALAGERWWRSHQRGCRFSIARQGGCMVFSYWRPTKFSGRLPQPSQPQAVSNFRTLRASALSNLSREAAVNLPSMTSSWRVPAQGHDSQKHRPGEQAPRARIYISYICHLHPSFLLYISILIFLFHLFHWPVFSDGDWEIRWNKKWNEMEQAGTTP